jgi:hypothetical protein
VLVKKASDAGYNMSVESLIDRLSEVRMAETVTVFNLNSKPVRETQQEEMNSVLQKFYDDLVKLVQCQLLNCG